MAVDLKYGKVTVEHGEIPADEPVFLLRAQDLLAQTVAGEEVPRLEEIGLGRAVKPGGPSQLVRWIAVPCAPGA